MKNLKRALSFALASVMLIGMMVVGAGAAEFTDAEDIVNTDAVNTLVALNVISGKEDGSYFDPTGTVTRGEMAKMITIALNGGKAPVIGTKETPTYTDIKGHWAESYIEYCSNLGIISGRGDGTFDPWATVTGTEAAKMMLVAMGWDSTIFKFTGSAWALNVNTEANKIDLYDEIEHIDPAKGLSRDNAAQLVYNGVLADTMTKSPNMTITNGEITWEYYPGGPSIFADKYDGLVWVGTFEGNDKMIDGLDEGYIQVDGDLDDADRTGEWEATPAFLPSDLAVENIGEEVKVLFKDGKGGAGGQPDDNDIIYGVFNTGATKVINTIKGDIKDNKKAEDKIKVGSVKYNAAETVTVVTNYMVGDAEELDSTGSASDNSAVTTALQGANGDTIKLVFNNDNKIAKAYIVESDLAVVTAVNAAKVTMNNGVGTITIEDNEIYADVAKDDIVVVTTLYQDKATDDGAYTIVTKAEPTSGEVTAFKDKETVSLDGASYKIYNKANLFDTAIDDAVRYFEDDGFEGDNHDGHIGDTFDLYFVNGYVRAAVKTSENATNYSVIIATNHSDEDPKTIGDTFNPLKIQVLDANNVKTILTVSEDSDDTGVTNYTEGSIITWTGNKDDAVVDIEKKMDDEAAELSYDDDTKALNGKVATSAAVIFLKNTSDSNKWKAYSLRALDAADFGNAISLLNADGKVIAAAGEYAGKPDGATDNTVYGIISAYNGSSKNADGVYFYNYTIVSNEETYTVDVDEKLTKGSLVSFEPNADGEYDTDVDFTVLTDYAVYVKEYSEADGTLTFYTAVTGSDEAGYEGLEESVWTLPLDKACQIVYVDVDGDKAGSEIGIDPFDSVTGYKNALFVMNDSNEKIVAILVETSNEAHIADVADIVPNDVDDDGIKSLADGVYNMTSAAAEELGDVGDDLDAIVVIKFTSSEGNTNTLLTVKKGSDTTYTEEHAEFTAGGHYFYVNKSEWAAGTHTYTIVETVGEGDEAVSSTIASGSIVIAE